MKLLHRELILEFDNQQPRQIKLTSTAGLAGMETACADGLPGTEMYSFQSR
ncbi:hypothetical protein MC7420_2690 [Coleofasciculus chthonoplastes PCC 7420]|uniref:Uncharacterized protein n=1 Tax=Coleofasciculus chthonoplastes PCC 7420 TaxID=118168 RepID=B4VYM3_9CYAN|nr:hypothetical protein MC7420_2690 [Coleofasciculus chthonoplastes PCC 7420]